MSTRTAAAPIALALAFMAACDRDPTAPDGLTLEISATAFEVGETSVARLTNLRDAVAFYDFCGSALQILTGAGWVTIESLRLCPVGFAGIEPGATVTTPIPLEQPGTFRFRLPVRTSKAGAVRHLHSPVFVVSEP